MSKAPSQPTDLPWRRDDAGVIVRVRLTPKSSKDEIGGIDETPGGPALRARVRAVPSEGQANAAIEQLLARWLDVAKSRVALISGGRSRMKTLHIAGNPDELGILLEAKLNAPKNK